MTSGVVTTGGVRDLGNGLGLSSLKLLTTTKEKMNHSVYGCVHVCIHVNMYTHMPYTALVVMYLKKPHGLGCPADVTVP